MSSHVIKGISFWTWFPTDGDHMDSCLSSLVLLRSFSVMPSMRRDNLIQPSLGIVMNPAALCEQGWYRCNSRVSGKLDFDGQLTPHHFYVPASSWDSRKETRGNVQNVFNTPLPLEGGNLSKRLQGKDLAESHPSDISHHLLRTRQCLTVRRMG